MFFKDPSSPDHSVILYLLSASLAVLGLHSRALVAGRLQRWPLQTEPFLCII